MSSEERVHRFPVDAHVHFHYPERVAPTLDRAVANLAAVAGRDRGLIGALLLAEAAQERVFRTLRSGHAGAWQFESDATEPASLLAESSERRVLIVCGRQIRCRNGLEVLALGTETEFPEGVDLADAVRRVRGEGAVAVVPWGFGKWVGTRGARVRQLFESDRSGDLYIGDNGGRLASLGLPHLVTEGERLGHRILPGSDPFPFGADHRRVGAFGFIASIPGEGAVTWTTLRAWLDAQAGSPEAFGRALGTVRFTINQLGIQIYNLIRRQRSYA
jgi:hypothetical protein